MKLWNGYIWHILLHTVYMDRTDITYIVLTATCSEISRNMLLKGLGLDPEVSTRVVITDVFDKIPQE